MLRFYLDMSEDEAARAMGVSKGTVKSATSRAVAAAGRGKGGGYEFTVAVEVHGQPRVPNKRAQKVGLEGGAMPASCPTRKSLLLNDVGHNVLAPKIKGYAFFDIDRRNFLPLIRSSRSILTLRLVRSLVRPVANISFIGVQ